MHPFLKPIGPIYRGAMPRPAGCAEADACEVPSAELLPAHVNPGGQTMGVPDVLNQVAQSITSTALPIIRDEILPIIQRDTAMQREIGAAAGHAVYDDSKVVIWGVGALVAAAAIAVIYKAVSK